METSMCDDADGSDDNEFKASMSNGAPGPTTTGNSSITLEKSDNSIAT